MRHFYLLLLLFLATISNAATNRSIRVEWGYTPPSSPAVDGYVLYMEGTKVCFFPDATTTAGDCIVSLSKSSTSFTLTASFVDKTESPHSAPFIFVLDTFDKFLPPKDFTTEVTQTNNNVVDYSKITYKWEVADTTNIKGYNFYINNNLACTTSDTSLTEFTCTVPKIASLTSFNMTMLFLNGEESNYSNNLKYIP